MSNSPKQFDFLVLGSGIAGLTFALKVAHSGTVAIITKKSRAESNTNYAQGGIAAVTSEEDSFESHVRDTLDAGGGLCNEAIVRSIVEEGPARIEELIQLGMKFTERESHGHLELDLGREGGHSNRRILHAKDVTGREIERALLAAIAAHENITVLENQFKLCARRLNNNVTFVRPAVFCQVTGETACPITALTHFCAICIEYSHEKINRIVAG